MNCIVCGNAILPEEQSVGEYFGAYAHAPCRNSNERIRELESSLYDLVKAHIMLRIDLQTQIDVSQKRGRELEAALRDLLQSTAAGVPVAVRLDAVMRARKILDT